VIVGLILDLARKPGGGYIAGPMIVLSSDKRKNGKASESVMNVSDSAPGYGT